MKNVLKYNDQDNVITVLDDIYAGESMQFNGRDLDFLALDDIPAGHKIACIDIKENDFIVKSATPIAQATMNIRRGEHVHTHNTRELLNDWGRENYQYNPEHVEEIADAFRLDITPKLYGFKRGNGLTGFRNHLLVLSTVICANKVVENICRSYPDVIAVQNESGCMVLPVETDRIKKTLLSMARNPNVGAVVFVGLGCEYLDAESMAEQIKEEKPAAYIRIQDWPSSLVATQKTEMLIEEMLTALSKQVREEVGLDAIVIGTKCGASDWTSGVSSNPAIGYASDIVVKAGGSSLLGETQGWFGGEQMLLMRARTKGIADDIVELMRDVYDKCISSGHHLGENNPTPGNKAGGITTLVEKALGNLKKSGTAPVEGVLHFGEYPKGKGLYVMENPGLDPISVLGATCSSANIILFSTGRGTPTGTPLAPVIKISASKNTCRTFAEHIDIDLSGIIDGQLTIEKAGRIIFNEIIAVANGKLTKSEMMRHREFAFPLLTGAL